MITAKVIIMQLDERLQQAISQLNSPGVERDYASSIYYRAIGSLDFTQNLGLINFEEYSLRFRRLNTAYLQITSDKIQATSSSSQPGETTSEFQTKGTKLIDNL